ncbi:MAG: hypothetical protein AAF493_26450, partial [Pseudomonadota bacterium]
MQIPTNKLALMHVAIETQAVIRQTGDRVIFGSDAERRETAWTARQSITRYQKLIADTVHAAGGIVSTRTGDTLECQLPTPLVALRAASELHHARQREQADSDHPVRLRVGLGYGALLIEGVNVSGTVLERTRALVDTAGGGSILATPEFAERLPSVPSVVRRPTNGPESPVEVLWRPELTLKLKGRTVVISEAKPTVKMGTDGRESARVSYHAGRFIVSSAIT